MDGGPYHCHNGLKNRVIKKKSQVIPTNALEQVKMEQV